MTTDLFSGPSSGSHPINPAAREHTARVEKAVFVNRDSGFGIYKLADGRTAKGRTGAEPLEEYGPVYRFLGRWKDDPKWGPQFWFDTYTQAAPAGRNGVIRYLVKLCGGIGEKTAAKLYDAYGGDTCKTLREDAARVVADGLLHADTAEQASAALAAEAQYEGTKLDLFDLFGGRGFPADALIPACVTRWGAKAPSIIRRNPFALLSGDMPGCGFKRCDKLWKELGLDPLALKRQMYSAVSAIRDDDAGHTWHDINDVVRAARNATPGGDPIKAIKLGIRAKRLRPHRDAADRLWVSEAKKGSNEAVVAAAVARLMRYGRPDWPGVDTAVSRLSDHQAERVTLLGRSCVGLLTGTPGTGKTFTAAAIIRHVVATHGSECVAVAAPTGKAAVRVTQALKEYRIPINATTLHRLLGLGQASFVKGDDAEFDEFDPLPHRFLFVDEVSMLDTDLAAAFFRAVADGTHVLLIGDPYQLPPVGHGAPLRDLIAAGVPNGELTEIRRNAGMIVRACRSIKDGGPVETADIIDVDAGDNLKHIEAATPTASLEVLDALLEHLGRSKSYHPIWQTQVVVGVNDKGELSRKAVNDRLQQLLNPDGLRAEPNPFRVGDKIICLRNGKCAAVRIHESLQDATDPTTYSTYRDPTTNSPAQVYVANGEIGRVLAVNATHFVARFSEADEMVRVAVGKPKRGENDAEGGDRPGSEGEAEGKGRGCDFDLAYACTCHKLQGSESPCVVILADENSGRVASREWWYTAVSRASKLCVVIGPRATMERQAARVSLKRRKTFLAELVKEGVARA